MNQDPELSQLCKKLFDKGQFRAELTVAKSPVGAYKKCLRLAQVQLDAWFQAEVDIEQLLACRAWLIDQILQLAWGHLDWKDDPEISLLACGGYGRGELHPRSDIDLLILIKGRSADKYRDNIEAFLTLLWDINLEVGHSVRTLKECANEAKKDLTIITNLIESRTVSGNDELHLAMLTSIRGDKMWSSKLFLKEKFKEQRARHRKFNDTEYNLEPNIKNSPGGLRDIQTILWATRRHYGAENIQDLVSLNFLSDREYKLLKHARNFLWRVRWALHSIAGRPEERLLFDFQPKLAEQFGYRDNEKKLAIEQFMHRYFRCILSLVTLNDVLLQHLDDEILTADKEPEIIPLNEQFQVRNNYIEACDRQLFAKSPAALLEVFVLMTQNPSILGIRASTIRQITANRKHINSRFRSDKRNQALFIELMKAPFGLTINLRRMLRYGVLGRYLPNFGKIIGQMQHDLFHSLTVDAHTISLIKHLRAFSYKENSERFPVAHQLISKVSKPHLLIIAGIFHDIAKGRGGDHSELGAVDAREFCENHGLLQWESNLVGWLVKKHLIFSMTAQRKDLSDPDVINEFANLMGDQEHLDYLYLLTVADINATNSTLWNSWRASLMRTLYDETRKALARGLHDPIKRQERISSYQQAARDELNSLGVGDTEIQALWSTLDDEYFISNTIRDYVWHGQNIPQHPKDGPPLVLVRETTARAFEGGTKIFIYTQDQDELFAACTALINQLYLDIQDARIITSSDGHSLNSFIVLEEDGSPIGNNLLRIEEIKQTLTRGLMQPENFPRLISRRTPRQLKHFNYPAQALISNDPINQHTILEIIAPDRPGLLAIIGQCFMELDIYIHKAKIASLGERLEDVFFITDEHHQPISDPEHCQRICSLICQRLDDRTQQDASGSQTLPSSNH